MCPVKLWWRGGRREKEAGREGRGGRGKGEERERIREGEEPAGCISRQGQVCHPVWLTLFLTLSDGTYRGDEDVLKSVPSSTIATSHR